MHTVTMPHQTMILLNTVVQHYNEICKKERLANGGSEHLEYDPIHMLMVALQSAKGRNIAHIEAYTRGI